MGDACCNGNVQQLEDLKEFARQADGTYKITGEMVIGDVVAAFPQAATVMLGYGLHCVGCHANAFDTVEDGARGHGMPDEEILQMITELNTVINHKIENIEFTERAIAKVLELRAMEAGKDMWPLRIAVQPGGCAGFGYDMDFGEEKENDIKLQFGELVVLVDPESMGLMKGSKIDYIDSLRGSGFKIENPNAQHSCGCGKSFS
jgi:iron-sulfur cluster assembly accessory protein